LELSVAYEAYRHNDIQGKVGFKEEMRDAVQRVVHPYGDNMLVLSVMVKGDPRVVVYLCNKNTDLIRVFETVFAK